MELEKKNDVHSKEKYKSDMKKSMPDRYAEAKQIDWGMCANDYIIDVNKRGRSKDITESGEFKLDEPNMKE